MSDGVELAIQQIRFCKLQIEKWPGWESEFWYSQIAFWERSKAFWEAVSQFNGSAGIENVTPTKIEAPKEKKCLVCKTSISRGRTCSNRCRKKLSRIGNK